MKPLLCKTQTTQDLARLQRLMATAVMRPLTPKGGIQPSWFDGRKTKGIASEWIKPNDRLTSLERLEIYNRQYWFRILDCFYDDFPRLRAVLGDRRFEKLAQVYLSKNPSRSFSLRNLGDRLVEFLKKEPQWIRPHEKVAVDMARFEWAQIETFDGESKSVLTAHDLFGCDPKTLRLELQPYLRLLEFDYHVDDFLSSDKKSREVTSNSAKFRRGNPRSKLCSLPKFGKIYLALHRQNHSLYYKRLSKGKYRILKALEKGETLQAACLKADRVGPEQIKGWFENWMSLGWFCSKSE